MSEPDRLALLQQHLCDAHARIGQLERDMERSIRMIGERAQRVARLEQELQRVQEAAETTDARLKHNQHEYMLLYTEMLQYKRELAWLRYAVRTHVGDSPTCLDDEGFWECVRIEREVTDANKEARHPLPGVPARTFHALREVRAAALGVPSQPDDVDAGLGSQHAGDGKGA